MTTSPAMQSFFLQKGGEAGRLIRSVNWRATPLGDPSTWPPTLLHAIRFMLDSSLPMYIAWGPQHTMLYNDAYIPTLGPARHPRMMGSSLKEVSPEVWEFVQPLYEKVWRGEQVHRNNYPLNINKNGRIEQYFFDLTYTPLYLEDGSIGGLQAVFIETTDKLRAIQKLEEVNEQLSFAIEATELGTWDLNTTTNKFSGNARLKSWFGLEPEDEIPLSLAFSVIASEDRDRVEAAIQEALQPESGGNYDIEYIIVHPVTDKRRIVRAKGRAWFNEQNMAYRFNGTLQDISEQAASRQRISENEERLRFALHAGGLGSWELDLRTMVLEASSHCKANFGQPLNEPFTYDGLRNCIHPDDRQRQDEAVTKTITTGIDYDIDYRVIWPDASVHWVNVRGQLRRNAAGEPVSMVGLSSDITERKALEKGLRESESHFRRLADAVPAIIWVTAPDGSCTYLNKSWYNYTGQTEEEAKGFGWLDATHPDDKEKAGAVFLAANEAQEKFSLVYRLRNKAGDYRWAIDSGQPKFGADGVYEGMIGTVVDVHEEKLAQEALSKTTEHLQLATDSSQAGTWSLDIKTGELDWSALHKELWGYDPTRTDLVYEDWSKVILPEDREIALAQVTKAQNERLPYENIYRIRRAGDSVIRWMKSSGRFFYSEAGEPLMVTGISMDITDRMDAEKALRESEDRYQNFVRQSTEGIWRFEMAEPIPVELPATEQIDRFFRDAYLAECNDAMAQMYGYEHSAELINMRLADFFPRDADSEAYFTNFIQCNYRVENAESKEQTKTGEIKYFSNNLVGIVENGLMYRAWGTQRDITAQRAAEASIRESEERFRSLVEEATTATAVLEGLNWKLTVANEKMLQLWQKDRSIIGQQLLQFLPELAGQSFPSLLRSVYETGVTYSETDAPVLFDRNGKQEQVYVDFSYKALRNGLGEVYAILVGATDVTERYKFVKQLEESENRFRSLAEAAPLFVFIADEGATITYVNNELLHYVGLKDVAEFTGLTWESHVHKDDVERLKKAYAEAWQAQQPFTVEARFKEAATGHYQWHLFKEVPRFEGEQFKGFIGTGINIHQQKELTEKLEEEVAQRTAELVEVNDELADRNTDLSRAENFLTTVLDSSVEIVAAFDKDLTYTFLNEKAEQLMGLSREELIGERATNVFPNLKQDELYEQMLRALKGEMIHIPQRRTLANKEVVMETYIIPLLDKDKVEGVVTLSRDITPLVTLTDELQRSNSDLQQFAHVASHDLKEPVRKIRTFGSKLQYEFGKDLPERAQLYLNKMESAADRMYSMIEGVLLYSSLGALEQALEPVDLDAVLSNIETDLEVLIQEKGAVISRSDLPLVEGSPVLLYQLFYNLMNNSLKFTKANRPPVISISAEKMIPKTEVGGEWVRLILSDNGIGFSFNKQEEIFNTFSRLHSKDQFEGTGLGLALCKKIVERHGGTIRAEGVEDKGAKFIIEIPAKSANTVLVNG